MNNFRFFCRIAWLIPVLYFFASFPAGAYSVLTHQAIIDGAWKPGMVPLLQKKFPEITDEQLLQARAYAYGGAIIQDMGYYPMGSRFFTDLTHYVRSGDFVNNLISEAKNANEYAFAMGALAHYYADIVGHASGTNLSVPLIYPDLSKEHGSVITYEEDHKSHTRTEFAFDVVQAARQEYVPEGYRDFIGFKIAREQLDRAFQKTYGLSLKQIYIYLPLAEWAFRVSVKAVIPQFTKMAWFRERNHIETPEKQGVKSAVTYEELLEDAPASLRKEFKKTEKPGFSSKVMSMVMRVVPKVGPLSTLNFELPVPEAETLFIKSVNESVMKFEAGLFALQNQDFLDLPAYDMDTGSPTSYSEYPLSDESHEKLLEKQHKQDFEHTSGVLQNYLLAYFETLPAQPQTAKEKKAHLKTQKYLQDLKKNQLAGP